MHRGSVPSGSQGRAVTGRSLLASLVVLLLLWGCVRTAAPTPPAEIQAPAQASDSAQTPTPAPSAAISEPPVAAPAAPAAPAESAPKPPAAPPAADRIPVKGIYVTASVAANPKRLEELLGLIERTELNSMVVNVKDDSGNITYRTDQPLAVAAGAVHPDLNDLKAFTGRLKEAHVYAIARVVTFKDAYVPKYRADLAVARVGGGIWRDSNGVPWLNPYSKAAWDYILDVAKGAATSGFDEIQFDYVRFPTDGDLSAIRYPGKDDRPPARVIADFLAYARKELRPYGVRVSADVFGMVTSAQDDMGIGQHLEEISGAVDAISPMLYPSHYISGNLGLTNPNADPYQTVLRSLNDAKARWAKVPETGQAIMRPWLQDFSMGFAYGPKQVRDEIQATYDAGYQEWLLWNAANVYTEAALMPAQKR